MKIIFEMTEEEKSKLEGWLVDGCDFKCIDCDLEPACDNGFSDTISTALDHAKIVEDLHTK